MNADKVMLGAIVGFATGAILGILYAPDKGSATRKKIRDKGNDFTDDLKSKYNEFAHSVSDFADTVSENFQSAKQEAQDLADKGKAKFQEVKRDANNAASNL